MNISRRTALKLLAASAPMLSATRALRAASEAGLPQIEPGPFLGTRDSLDGYHCPEWYRDAKFGMWAHWGPQSAAEYGDWYARSMYVQGTPQYDYHVKRYGHPTKFGFKDVIGTWRADRFDADYLLGLYKKAGARYFVSMGVHHDGFDLWNSRFQPRWNAVASGPKKDVVGLFRKAADRHGLRFGVSEHLSNSFCWFGTSHGSDASGPLAGVPYDGIDPRYADLYHDYRGMSPDFIRRVTEPVRTGRMAMSRESPPSWQENYFQRIKDLVTQHEPDLLYTDGGIPFGDRGLALVAHHYNTSARRHGGRVEAVYTSKSRPDAAAGMCILDVERGLVDSIWPRPWQTDTCIGGWHYDVRVKYKTPKRVIDMLVDIVSRNGNLLLNVPLPNSGMPDPAELKIVEEITAWMAVNSEAIYATRPWKIFGDGPAARVKPVPGQRFNETTRKDFTSEEVRFTTKGGVLYAFFMGWPERQVVIAPLATTNPDVAGRIRSVSLLGHPGALEWTHGPTGLIVQLPPERPCRHGYALKISGLATA